MSTNDILKSFASRIAIEFNKYYELTSNLRKDVDALKSNVPVQNTIVANGRPDVNSTLTSDIHNQVSSAPIGCLFSSIDRPQGAALWQKVSDTQWSVVSGKYEKRITTKLFTPETGAFLFTRTNDLVKVSLVKNSSGAIFGTALSPSEDQCIPNGFKTYSGALHTAMLKIYTATRSTNGFIDFHDGTVTFSIAQTTPKPTNNAATGYYEDSGVIYPTNDSWPTE